MKCSIRFSHTVHLSVTEKCKDICDWCVLECAHLTDMFVFFLFLITPEAQESGITAFLTSVVELCRNSGNNWYRVYLIRKICSQHGVEFVLKLLKVDQMRWLFPEEVLQKVQLSTL